MPLFRYEVRDRNGQSMLGAIDAASEADARQRLIGRGYAVNMIAPAVAPPPQSAAQSKGYGQPAVAKPGIRTSRASAPPRELMVFFRSLQAYLQSGMSAFQALNEVATHTPNRGMRTIAQRMASGIQAGGKLSDAMIEFPRAFPPHVVGVVAAGELGGFLPIMAGDIALDYELAQRASSKWLTVGVRLGWINAIGTFLIAPFLPIFIARLVSDSEDGIRSGIIAYLQWTMPRIALPLLIVFGGYHIIAMILRQPGLRPFSHGAVLRLPTFGRASRMRSLANFTRILWRLQNSGILPIQAWDAATRASENIVIASQLQDQVSGLRSGMKFSQALAASGHFTSEDARALAASEMGGQTADALQRLAAHYEDAALAAVSRTKYVGLRWCILVNLIAFGVCAIAMEALPTLNVMKDLGI